MSMDRRVFFKIAASGLTGYFLPPMQLFGESPTTTQAASQATILGTAKNCIFILLTGAPSQTDTMDLKVGPWTPATFNPYTVNGVDWPTGLLPSLAGQLNLGRFSVIRSCQSTALVHALLQSWTQIARNPASATGSIAPNVGSVVASEFESQRTAGQKLPGFVSFASGGSLQGAGYFSGRYSPFDVTPSANGLTNLSNVDGASLFTARYNMLSNADAALRATPSIYGTPMETMAGFYSDAQRMMYDPGVTNAFRFAASDQAKYGNTNFGNACVTARNLLMSNLGARYIQIDLGGWDNHQNIYSTQGLFTPAKALDVGLANLIADLATIPGSDGRALLDETLIVAKGEFGRTVGNITSQNGRDHYFVHSALVAGGGIIGGRAIGSTTPDGAYVQDPGWSAGRPVYAEDVAATIYSALGIDYSKTLHNDPLGRGFQYVMSSGDIVVGQPILELFQ
jgi:hypothetical protein